jgi:hypothetical protein
LTGITGDGEEIFWFQGGISWSTAAWNLLIMDLLDIDYKVIK